MAQIVKQSEQEIEDLRELCRSVCLSKFALHTNIVNSIMTFLKQYEAEDALFAELLDVEEVQSSRWLVSDAASNNELLVEGSV